MSVLGKKSKGGGLFGGRRKKSGGSLFGGSGRKKGRKKSGGSLFGGSGKIKGGFKSNTGSSGKMFSRDSFGEAEGRAEKSKYVKRGLGQ